MIVASYGSEPSRSFVFGPKPYAQHPFDSNQLPTLPHPTLYVLYVLYTPTGRVETHYRGGPPTEAARDKPNRHQKEARIIRNKSMTCESTEPSAARTPRPHLHVCAATSCVAGLPEGSCLQQPPRRHALLRHRHLVGHACKSERGHATLPCLPALSARAGPFGSAAATPAPSLSNILAKKDLQHTFSRA